MEANHLAKQTKPTTSDVSSRYSALLTKRAELSARFDELRAELGGNTTTCITTTNAAGDVTGHRVVESLGAEAVRHRTWTAEQPRPQPKPKVRHAGGAALLGHLLPEPPQEEFNPQPLPSEWSRQDRYREISREIESITEALKLIDPEIEKARREHSQHVAAERIGDYSVLVERAVDRARELGDALLEMHSFINHVRLGGVERKYFRPVNLEAFGDLAMDFTPLMALVRRAVELGHVDAEKLPDWKMPAPLDYLS